MVLSDDDIKKEVKKGHIGIDPYDEKSVQPSSYDLHLDCKFLLFKNYKLGVYDVKEKNDINELVDVSSDGFFIIHPGEFILGSTLEKVSIPANLVSRIEGKSSIGRIGLIVHATAGYVDPGFSGNLTLEMTNLLNIPIKIYPGMKIAQLAFFEMKSTPSRLYGDSGNKYKGQEGPTQSRIWKDFTS